MNEFTYKGFKFYQDNGKTIIQITGKNYLGENFLIDQYGIGYFTINEDDNEFKGYLKDIIDEIFYRLNSLYKGGEYLQAPYNRFFPLFPDFQNMFYDICFDICNYPELYQIKNNGDLEFIQIK